MLVAKKHPNVVVCRKVATQFLEQFLNEQHDIFFLGMDREGCRMICMHEREGIEYQEGDGRKRWQGKRGKAARVFGFG